MLSSTPASSSLRNQQATLLLFGFPILLGAALLFLIQLVFARMVLPLLGGSASVWSMSTVFYQAVLLAGYGYAHLLPSRLSMRAQMTVHGVLLMAPLLMLPFHVPDGWVPPAGSDPTPWTLGVLAVGAGLPFFAVATISPLLQKWFASTGHPRSGDPYFLYAAGNAGSLAGLLSYPFLIEPNSTLAQQAKGWAIGYGILVPAVATAAWIALRRAPRATVMKDQARRSAAPSSRRRARWVTCALVPSSLMLSVTSYISSDLAAVPLLWVLPLAVYLITFILAFSRRAAAMLNGVRRLTPIVLVAVAVAVSAGFNTPVFICIVLHLAGFFLISLVCHGQAATDRPPPDRLTEFYFYLSLGGVLGGLLNALVAPRLFDGMAEYHLILIAAAALAVPALERSIAVPRRRWLDFLLPALLAVLSLVLTARVAGDAGPAGLLLASAVPGLLCWMMSRHRVRFTLGMAAILLTGYFGGFQRGALLHTERSYFGIHRVYEREGRFHWLIHGSTLHGLQYMDPARRSVPLGYYHPAGPLGAVFAAYGADLNGPIAVAGLGAGAIAAYGRPQQEMTFFEIDPAVQRIASDQAYFTYLHDSPAKVQVVMGDARLSLQAAPDAHYQLIILDAYSSDAIPVHLLTREAVQLYLRKLRPGGLLAFHISNLHYDLYPVITALTRDANLVCLLGDDGPGFDSESIEGLFTSRWAVAARGEVDLAPLLKKGNWTRDPGNAASRVWTDDYSSLLDLLRWK